MQGFFTFKGLFQVIMANPSFFRFYPQKTTAAPPIIFWGRWKKNNHEKGV